MTMNDPEPRFQWHAIIQRLISLISLISFFMLLLKTRRQSTLMGRNIQLSTLLISFCYAVIGAVSGNGIIKINLLLHAFPVVTAKERNVISIAFRHRSVHDGHNCRGTTGQWS